MRIQVGDCFSVPEKSYNQTVSALEIGETTVVKDPDYESDTEYGWAGLASLAGLCAKDATSNVASETTTPVTLLIPPGSAVLVTVTGYQPNVEDGIKVTITKQIEERPAVAFSCYVNRSFLVGLLTA